MCECDAIHCVFCNFKSISLSDLQLLDAVMKVIEPSSRFHRSEVSLSFVCESEAGDVICYEISVYLMIFRVDTFIFQFNGNMMLLVNSW